MKRYKYDCRKCGTNAKASELCIFNLDQWCGTLDVYCFDCAGNLTRAEFDLLSRRNWKRYTDSIMQKTRRKHLATWDNLEDLY